jgi:hypothetical protein
MMLVGKSAPFALLKLLANEQAAALRSRYEGGATEDQNQVARAIICSAHHAVSCVFRFDEADYQDTTATALDGRRQRTDAEFVRILGKSALRPESPVLRNQAQSSHFGASSSALASLLWELIERAGVNRVGPVPAAPAASTLSSELARLRNAAQGIRISPDIALLDVLTTYGNHYFGSSRWHVRFREAVPKFLAAGLQPQAFLLAYTRAISAKEIVLSEGVITCQGRVTAPKYGEAAKRGPYLALVVATDLKDGAGLQAIRAYAQPVHSARHLMPVESGQERDALEMLFAFREMAAARFASLEITITKPVFDIDTEIGPVCPAFVLTIASPRQPKGISFCIDLTDEEDTGTTSAWIGRQKRLSLLGPLLQIPRTSLKLPPHAQVSWLLDTLYGPQGVLNENRTGAP